MERKRASAALDRDKQLIVHRHGDLVFRQDAHDAEQALRIDDAAALDQNLRLDGGADAFLHVVGRELQAVACRLEQHAFGERMRILRRDRAHRTHQLLQHLCLFKSDLHAVSPMVKVN